MDTEQSPNLGVYQNVAGGVEDLDLLPRTIGDLKEGKSDTSELQIKFGPLEYDYKNAKEKLLKGQAALRLVKDKDILAGFYIASEDNNGVTIDVIWVSPDYRRKDIASQMLEDAEQRFEDGDISMDVWGGKPMTNLAQKHGYQMNPGGGFTNRYTKFRK